MLAENQEALFTKWLDEHKGLIFRIVRAYAVSQEDRDDLFQEILLQLWSSIPRFNGECKESTWVYRVGFNTALVWQRGQKKRRRDRRRLIDIDEVAVTEAKPVDLLRDESIVTCVYAAVRELPKIDGSVILMYLDGLSYSEMAEVLGISESNVGVRLNRARKKLAELLKGLIDDV